MKATKELTADLAVDLADVTFLPSPAIGVLASSEARARSHGATAPRSPSWHPWAPSPPGC